MKAKNVFAVVLIAFAVQIANAQDTQDTQATGWRARFTQVRVVVKTTIDRWWGYWTGGPQPAAPQPAQTQQSSTAGTPAQVPAPVKPTEKPAVKPQAPAPSVSETPEQAQMRAQPIYSDKKQNSTLEDLRNVKERVSKTSVLSVSKLGKQGTSNLAKTKTGVPFVDFGRMRATKSIPRLDIGTENQISAKDFSYGKLNWNANSASEIQRLPLVPSIYSHELSVALRVKAQPVLGPRKLESNLKYLGKPVDQASIDAINYNIQGDGEVTTKPYTPFSEDQLKLAAALILYSRGSHCHMVMGIFHQLEKAPATKTEATYHLGACADQLKMSQAAWDNLSYVIKTGDPDYAQSALDLLAKDLPMIYEKDFYKLAKSIPNFKQMINDKNRDEITYRMAKGAYRMGDYPTSSVYADQVDEKSDLYADARVLSAMNSFATGEKGRALQKLQEVWKLLENRKEPNSNIRALTAINMARMYFAQNKFSKALDAYMQIPKDHPFWVQGLIEQGWTQLALEDFAGAIGNMYSLHSPYFKAVYQPESFVVRTIGYLNICQYGDAYKTLTWLERDYREYHKQLEKYLERGAQPLSVYKTVKSYIQGKSNENLEGVPYQVWREMARRKDFLNIQTALNDKSDESHSYEGVNEKIKKEKAGIRGRSEAAKRRFDQLKAKIAHLRVDRSLIRERGQWEASMKLEKDLIVGLRYQLAILEQGRQGYLEFQRQCQTKLDSESAELSVAAGKVLSTRAKQMRDEMNRVLENNEFLRYEVFAGSGENIRYQVAGGEVATANRVPAHIKPTKMMNWSFDGEFWEDEIGSYRSSLQNNCPKQGEQALNHN